MARAVILGIAAVLLALWVVSGLHAQPSVKPEQSTVQAQFTALTQPSPTPTTVPKS